MDNENQPVKEAECNRFVILALLANLFFVFAAGYPADLEYWREWISQLQSQGYGGFEGN